MPRDAQLQSSVPIFDPDGESVNHTNISGCDVIGWTIGFGWRLEQPAILSRKQPDPRWGRNLKIKNRPNAARTFRSSAAKFDNPRFLLVRQKNLNPSCCFYDV